MPCHTWLYVNGLNYAWLLETWEVTQLTKTLRVVKSILFVHKNASTSWESSLSFVLSLNRITAEGSGRVLFSGQRHWHIGTNIFNFYTKMGLNGQ